YCCRSRRAAGCAPEYRAQHPAPLNQLRRQGMATENDVLLTESADGVITLTLNRPDQFNALSEDLLGALQDSLAAIAQDDSVRCVVLAAHGRAFCAGHDLKQMRANP